MTTNKNDHVSIITANRVDHGPMVNKQTSIVYVFMYDHDFKQDVGVVSFAIHTRGIQEVHGRGTGHALQGRPARH